jgi:hypothetical protein
MLGRGSSGKIGSNGTTRELRRGFADFALALALFWAVALAVSGSHTRAHAVPLPAISKGAGFLDDAASSPTRIGAAESRHALERSHKAQADQEHALVLLSLAFAAIVACNLAFWRHLRRVYASPRRSVWRRG